MSMVIWVRRSAVVVPIVMTVSLIFSHPLLKSAAPGLRRLGSDGSVSPEAARAAAPNVTLTRVFKVRKMSRSLLKHGLWPTTYSNYLVFLKE